MVGFMLSVKVGLDLLDPVGAGKKPAVEATEEDVMVRPKALLRCCSRSVTAISFIVQ